MSYRKTEERPATKGQREQVLRLHERGKTVGEIARTVWLSGWQVRWIIRSHQEDLTGVVGF